MNTTYFVNNRKQIKISSPNTYDRCEGHSYTLMGVGVDHVILVNEVGAWSVGNSKTQFYSLIQNYVTLKKTCKIS